MSNFIVINDDKVNFDPTFGHRVLAGAAMTTISGSGHATISGKKVCVATDISGVSLSVNYIAGAFSVPGNGTLRIQALQPDQPKAWCLSTQPVITVGSKFIAIFTPTKPAQMPSSPNTPDVATPTMGTGSFSNSQLFVTAG